MVDYMRVSNAEMSRADVLKKCQERIDSIWIERKELDRKLEDCIISKLENRILRKLKKRFSKVSLPPITREEAVEFIKNVNNTHNIFESYDYPQRWIYGRQLETCERIKRLCETSTAETIRITADDLWNIG